MQIAENEAEAGRGRKINGTVIFSYFALALFRCCATNGNSENADTSCR